MSGRLGYATTADVGDDEAPATRGLVDVGGDVQQLAVGAAHTCAVRTDGEVVCWGYGIDGRLGYGSESDVGDDEIPASVGPVEVFDLADDAPPIGPREPYARCLSDYQCESGACIELESGDYDGFCAGPCSEATDCPWRPGIHRACTEFASGHGCNFDCEDIDCPDSMSCVYVTGTPEGGSQPMCFWDKE
jgi:hypothetical protein